MVFDRGLSGTCWREVWLVPGGGGEVGECPSVDAGIHSAGCWQVMVVQAVVVGVGETYYGVYLLAMRCSFLLFVRRSFLFLARFLPWGAVGFFSSASLTVWLIAKIFLLPLLGMAPHFCSAPMPVPRFLPLSFSIGCHILIVPVLLVSLLLATLLIFPLVAYCLIDPMLMTSLMLAPTLIFFCWRHPKWDSRYCCLFFLSLLAWAGGSNTRRRADPGL